jgi:hypothetical protein
MRLGIRAAVANVTMPIKRISRFSLKPLFSNWTRLTAIPALFPFAHSSKQATGYG